MDNKELQFNRMTKTPIPRLVISLAIPTIISMMVSAIYNTADTYFVSKLGTSASGAAGIVFPIMTIIQAIGFMLGLGGGSWISRLLGQNKDKDARQVAAASFYSSIVFGLILLVIGVIFLSPILRLLGATDTMLPYAEAYARYIFYAAPIMTASFVLNNLLRSEGHATYSMIGIAIGGLLNIALDPLFIFTFNMGMAGAAIATSFSQLISFILLLVPFIRKKTVVSLSPANLPRKISVYIQILKIGLPSFFRQGLLTLASILLNTNAAIFGDAAVSAMTIVGRVSFLMNSFFIGLGQGFQPVAGYNYGAKIYSRMKKAYIFTLVLGTVAISILAVACFIFAKNLVMLFIADDSAVIEIGTVAMRAQCIAIPFMGLGILCNMTYQTLGKSLIASILSAARQGIFFVPFIYILPRVMGLTGVELSQAAADICTFFLALPFAVIIIRFASKTPDGADKLYGEDRLR